MYVDVDFGVDPATVVLAEASDCTRFHVAVRGSGDAGTLDRALRAGGRDVDATWARDQRNVAGAETLNGLIRIAGCQPAVRSQIGGM